MFLFTTSLQPDFQERDGPHPFGISGEISGVLLSVVEGAVESEFTCLSSCWLPYGTIPSPKNITVQR